MSGRRKPLALSALALLLALATLAWSVRVSSRTDAASEPTAAEPLRPGVSDWLEIPSPDAEFITLDGSTARLADFRGRIVLVNFWGTWCPPCLREIPELVEVQRVIDEFGATVIGPAVDSGSPENIRAFADAQGINYPIFISEYKVAVGEFGARGYPFTLLIDEDGLIRKQYLGPQTARTLLRDFAALSLGDDNHGS